MRFEQLHKRMDERSKQLRHKARELQHRVAYELVLYLAFNTPVDTSRALSNWVIGIADPIVINRGPHVTGQHGSTQIASASRTAQLARARLESTRYDGTIWISNGVPYILKLEHEHPQGGFVQSALIFARIILSRERLGLN